MKTTWKKFPHADPAYDYVAAALRKNWPRLHRGDCEPYPDEATLKGLAAGGSRLVPPMGMKEAATLLQEAWRAYHRGEFGKAVELGLSVGPLGYNVANKAANIYATYLEQDSKRKEALFQEAFKRGEVLIGLMPASVNAWYFYAQALGRYSQCISVAKALAQGIGGKVKQALERAIAVDPAHCDAHIALGAFHAEVIDKVGAMVGGLTFGASKDEAVGNFEKALSLNPDSAIARIEYANGLVMMYGKSRMDKASMLYEEAAACEPADAMERLDVELARSELEA